MLQILMKGPPSMYVEQNLPYTCAHHFVQPAKFTFRYWFSLLEANTRQRQSTFQEHVMSIVWLYRDFTPKNANIADMEVGYQIALGK